MDVAAPFSIARPEHLGGSFRAQGICLPIGTTALYRIYSVWGPLLYIGVTGNPIERWRKHACKKPWWYDVARIEWWVFPKEHLALAAEVQAIRAERPLYNVRSAVAA